MAGHLTTAEAARRLDVSKPTVRALLGAGSLRGLQVPHGSRSYWQVEEESVTELLVSGPHQRRQTRAPTRLERVEAEVTALRQTVDSLAGWTTPAPGNPTSSERERDKLRVRVVNLEEALARLTTASELQRQADLARATVVEHLLAALTGGEQVDALRRQAAENPEEALATFRRPGHIGELS